MLRCPKLIAKPGGQLWERWSCEGGRGILYATATSLPVQPSPVLNSVIPQRAFYDPGPHVCWSSGNAISEHSLGLKHHVLISLRF